VFDFVCHHEEGCYCALCGLNYDKRPDPSGMSQSQLWQEAVSLLNSKLEFGSHRVHMRLKELGPYLRSAKEAYEEHLNVLAETVS